MFTWRLGIKCLDRTKLDSLYYVKEGCNSLIIVYFWVISIDMNGF